MTGFGDAAEQVDGTHYAIELRSLNNRHYKASIKLSEGFASLEPEVDRWLRDALVSTVDERTPLLWRE